MRTSNLRFIAKKSTIMKTNSNYAFFGTPMVAVWVLEEMEKAEMLPKVIVTAPDRPAGRGMQLTESEVKVWAREHNIPILQPEKLDAAFRTEISAYECEVFVVAAYGKILSKRVLSLTPHGCINVHPSLLPKYRGAAPIEGQILSDEKEVGVSIMLLDEGMDTGPVLAQERIEISGWPVGRTELSEILARAGGCSLASVLPGWVAGTIPATPQDNTLVTFTRKIEKEDGLIDPTGPARENYLKYCAYEGWPGLYFFVERNGIKIRVKITKASYRDDAFVIEQVIPEGKREMPYQTFLASIAD
ncbi:MAG: methionyl-tRNA formyltransferase [Parcubacteria bacterium C7867-008]|nr:MAG: methionyl-tRNA formyltransferase [Parcubacteria bacterium C7867-008]